MVNISLNADVAKSAFERDGRQEEIDVRVATMNT